MTKKIQYAVKVRNPLTGVQSSIQARSVVWPTIVAKAEKIAAEPQNRGQEILILKKDTKISNKFSVLYYI